MSQFSPADHWLIRDSKNLIWGPVSRAEILDLIANRKLRPKTEISHSQSYWFFIEEDKELRKFFPEMEGTLGPEEEPEPTLATSSAATKTVPGEWLNEEYAEEFGYSGDASDGTRVAVMRTPENTSPTVRLPGGMPEAEDEPTFVPNLERGTDPTLSVDEDMIQEIRSSERRKRLMAVGIAIAVLLIVLTWSFLETKPKPSIRGATPLGGHASLEGTDAHVASLKSALLLGELSTIQEEINKVEAKIAHANTDHDARKLENTSAMAKAILRREFLVDEAGAVAVLKALLAKVRDEEMKAEMENLIGVYQLDSAPEEAAIALENAKKAKPNDPIFQLNLAMAYFGLGREGDAGKLLDTVRETTVAADRLLPQILIASAQLRPKEAESLLSQALLTDPHLDEARLLLAIVQLRAGKSAEALKNFRIFVDSLPGYRRSTEIKNFRLGNLPSILPASRTEIRSVMSRFSADETLLTVDGMISLMLGEYREAEQAFDRSLQRSPGNIFALKGMAYLRMREGRDFEIESLIKSKAAENPTSVAFAVLLAHSLTKQSKNMEALQSLDAALKDQKSPSFVNALAGEILEQLKQPAAAQYQKALEKNPLDLGAVRGLSRLGEGASISFATYAPFLPF